MKYLLIFLAAALAGQTATAAELSERMECTVVSVVGTMSSFLPPKVGDKIVLDASKGTIDELKFVGNSMIPIQNPLVKKFERDSAKYMVYFTALQNVSNTESSTLTVMMGAFSTGHPGDVRRSATIQSMTTVKHSGLSYIDEVQLLCQLATP